jgi:dTDP-4-dehydrorhamnose reductase
MRQQKVAAASDIRVSPTYIPDLVHTALDLLIDGERGLVHLANAGEITWADWARRSMQEAARIFTAQRFDVDLLVEKIQSELNWAARRPRQSVLTSERVSPMPSLEDAMERYFMQVDQKIIMEHAR